MTSFQIHEDKENILYNPLINAQKAGCRDIAHFTRSKAVIDKQNNENRRILGPVTNLQHNGVKWNAKISPRRPLARRSINVIENYDDVTAVKKNVDRAILDETCSLLPKTLVDLRAPSGLITPQREDSCHEVMSVDTSSNKKPFCEIVNKFDSRWDDLYTQPHYQKDIHLYHLEAERRHRPHPMYMSKQPELSDSMRCILVDWLVSISDEYNLVPDTLHLAVSYVDRFLSKMSVVRSKLQLVGVAAMMIAAKYEEIYPPDIAEFAFLTNDTYTVKQILRMEQLILRVLSFDLTVPTVQTFIDEYAVQGNISKISVDMAMFLSELCLVDSVHYISFLPSEIAASSLALSRHALEENIIWPQSLENISGYTLTKLFPIVQQQHKTFEESPRKTLQAVRVKFSQESFSTVSQIKARELIYGDG